MSVTLPRLSVIVPVCPHPDPLDSNGSPHPDLLRALDSACDSELDVELVVGVDGGAPKVVNAVDEWAQEAARTGVRTVRFVTTRRTVPTWGNVVRNHALEEGLATGKYLAFQDHDDTFTAGALPQLVREMELHPGRPGIFKMRVHHWTKTPVVLPAKQEIVLGNLGGHCLVLPNVPELIGRWSPETEYTADFNFVEETVKRFTEKGLPPFWSSTIISELRPKHRRVRHSRATRGG